MNIKLVGLAMALLALALPLWRLECVTGQLEAERLHHAATLKDRDEWKAAAEAYRREAVAQAENARLCLDREAHAARDAAERAAIVNRARPRARTAEEKNRVVDDETRRCAIERLNRPL